MTQAEKQINEMHGDMKVIKELLGRHDDTLYCPEFGVCPKLQRVEQIQTDCPAKKQALEGFRINTRTNRTANIIAGCALFIGVIAIIINVIL